jgi:hypothetical protein
MALMSPELLVTLTDDAGLGSAGFVAGKGAGTVLGPDRKYEQPETAKATSRTRDCII